MSTLVIDTLPAISQGMGLNRGTLSVIFDRYDKRGEARPQPVRQVGINKGIALFDVNEVEAWYCARHTAPKVTRGPGKQEAADVS